jgi:hypothetical protein
MWPPRWCHVHHPHLSPTHHETSKPNSPHKIDSSRTTEMSRIRIQIMACQWLIIIKQRYWPLGFSKGKHFTSMTITSRKKKAFYVHNNHMEIMCRDWEIELSAEIERLNYIQGNHVHTFYIHNIHGWSNFFTLLYVYYVYVDRNGNIIN